MQSHGLRWVVWCILLLLVNSCSIPHYDRNQLNANLANESWMRHVDTDPKLWVKNADYWFLTGQPNPVERATLAHPTATALSTVRVTVPEFTRIQVAGTFQVQILGGQDHTSLTIIGPHTLTQQIAVKVVSNTLYLTPTEKSRDELCHVIIRIGVRQLQCLTNAGPSVVLAHHIVGGPLTLTSTSGSILLEGDMALQEVNQMGCGTILVLGANTPTLTINAPSNGDVLVSGKVGLKQINHPGNGSVKVIGASSEGLSITAQGKGLTTVAGFVNLRSVTALDQSRVYLYWIDSNNLSILAKNQAIIGIAGAADVMNANLTGNARLYSENVSAHAIYLKTQDQAHANVNATDKLFANATGSSSIYYMETGANVAAANSGDAVILPMPADGLALNRGFAPARRKNYKGG